MLSLLHSSQGPRELCGAEGGRGEGGGPIDLGERRVVASGLGDGACCRLFSISALTGSVRTDRPCSSPGPTGEECVGDLGGDTIDETRGGEGKRALESLGCDGAGTRALGFGGCLVGCADACCADWPLWNTAPVESDGTGWLAE